MIRKFNERGHLSRTYNISFKDFKRDFVENNEHYKRHVILDEFKAYLIGISSIINQILIEVWINGSFVTDEVEPEDIDFVVFIEKNKIGLAEEIHIFNSQFAYIDVYGILLEDDLEVVNDWTSYWSYFFSTSRELHKKGFLKMKILVENGSIVDIYNKK